MRFYWERVEASRNFANKVWNASRFIMMNLEGVELREPKLDELHAADKWILSRVNTLAKDATENMDKFELGIAVQKVYDFIWDEFCDWYIEIAKVRTYKKDENPESANAALWTLKTVLVNALKLLHPFMPFITEEIFCTLQSDEETIMLSKWRVQGRVEFPGRRSRNRALQGSRKGYQKCPYTDGCSTFKKGKAFHHK